MAEHIPFPRSFDLYIQQGRKYLSEGRLREAEEYAKLAYDMDQTTETQLLYFTVLYESGFYQEVIDLFENRSEGLFHQAHLFELVVQCYIQVEDFLKAENLIHYGLSQAENDKERQRYQDLLQQLKLEREKAFERQQQKDQAIEKDLYELSSYAPLEQLDVLKKSQGLSDERLAQAYKGLLINPYVHELAKTQMLHDLKEIVGEGECDLLWFGQGKCVNLRQLETWTEQAIFRSLSEELENKLGQYPVEYEVVSNEMNLHLMLLYPFASDVILDVDFWLSLYMEPLQATTIEARSKEENEMKEWMNRLSQELEQS